MDDTKKQIAKDLNYKNPEKHANYITHDYVGNISDNLKKHLLNRRFAIEGLIQLKTKYLKIEKVYIKLLKISDITISFWMQKTKPVEGTIFLETSLGFLLIEIENTNFLYKR